MYGLRTCPQKCSSPEMRVPPKMPRKCREAISNARSKLPKLNSPVNWRIRQMSDELVRCLTN